MEKIHQMFLKTFQRNEQGKRGVGNIHRENN